PGSLVGLRGFEAARYSSICRGAQAGSGTRSRCSNRCSDTPSSSSAARIPSDTRSMRETVVVTTHDLEAAVRLREAFQKTGYRIEMLTTSERLTDVEAPALLVITGGLGEKRAQRLCREAIEMGRVPVIGLAEADEVAPAIVAQRLGMAECLRKPVDYAEVALLGKRIVERRRLQALTGIVGESEAILEALERVVQIAPVDATVLVTGESGTGEELIARGIHAVSPRRPKPFSAGNVAALPETLLESELFGHEKGAFAGAVGQ